MSKTEDLKQKVQEQYPNVVFTGYITRNKDKWDIDDVNTDTEPDVDELLS